MKDDILFLGCFYPPDEIDSIRKKTKGGIQNASNLLQWDYIHGLENNLGHPIHLMTRMSLGIYPSNYKDLLIRSHSFVRDSGEKGAVIGFWNTVPVRPFFFNHIGKKHVLRWCAGHSGRGIIIAYSYAMAPLLTSAKKCFPEMKTVLILPDLPRFTFFDKKSSLIYQLRHWFDEKDLQKALKHIDLLVPITKQMGELLDPDNRIPKVVIDGMVNVTEMPEKQKKDDGTFTIAYTGALTKAYGIIDLLDVMNDIEDPALRLIICGAGEAEPEIKEKQQKDPRVIFQGLVSSEEARAIQQNADLLVNPRKDSGEYTKYSFPSKILQYMASGTPVLCYKLLGTADEYDYYLIYIRDKESMASTVQRVLQSPLESLRKKGVVAQEFVLKNKSPLEQTKKILDHISKMN